MGFGGEEKIKIVFRILMLKIRGENVFICKMKQEKGERKKKQKTEGNSNSIFNQQ